MGSYLLGSIVETGGGGRSQAQQRRRIREQQRDSSLQPEQGLVGVLPPRPSQAGAIELHPHLLRHWQARLNDGPWLKRQGAKCPLCSTAIRDLKALRQHCCAKHMTQWHMLPSHPPGSLLARAATPCPWCALTIKRPTPSCLMVHIAGLEAVRQVCPNDVHDDAGTGAPADVCRDTPLLDGHPRTHSHQTPTRGRAGHSSTAEAEAQPREGSRQRQGNRSPGRQPGTSSTATGRGQVATAPRCATQPPRAGHDRALHVHQQALAAGGHPAPSVPDQCGVEETHGELAEAKHVAPSHDLPSSPPRAQESSAKNRRLRGKQSRSSSARLPQSHERLAVPALGARYRESQAGAGSQHVPQPSHGTPQGLGGGIHGGRQPSAIPGQSAAGRGTDGPSADVYYGARLEEPRGDQALPRHAGHSGGGCTADGGVAHTHAADATIQTRRAGCKPDQARVLRLVLVNPHQLCYANAVLLAWLWLTVSDSGDFRDFAGALSLAMTSLPEARPPVYFPALQVWKHVLRRWQRPTAQHDAHEFWGYLATQALAPAFRGRWEARTLLPGALKRVEDSGCLLAGLTLPWLDHPVSLQEALQSWCLQPAKHAMTSLPRALCLHLPRYRQENGVSKSFAPLHMAAEEVVHVPYFTGILQVAWAPYVLTAGVMHHGESLESGHYRCFLSLHGEWHVTDDGKRTQPVTALQLEEIATTCYLLYLRRVNLPV